MSMKVAQVYSAKTGRRCFLGTVAAFQLRNTNVPETRCMQLCTPLDNIHVVEASGFDLSLALPCHSPGKIGSADFNFLNEAGTAIRNNK